MLATILLSVGVVFLAELGDKSQLMALTFALRYRWWVVLGGIATAAAAVHLLSAGVGHFLGAALPARTIAIFAAITFLAVALWMLREHATEKSAAAAESENTDTSARKYGAAPYFVVLSAFLLAELGDRTMFATAALAAEKDWAGVWLGSTVGMVAADALAIGLGILVGKHLPERLIGIGSGLLFLYFGTATLLGVLAPALGAVAVATLAALAPALAGLVIRIALLRTRTDRHCAAPTPAAAPAMPADLPDPRPRSAQ